VKGVKPEDGNREYLNRSSETGSYRKFILNFKISCKNQIGMRKSKIMHSSAFGPPATNFLGFILIKTILL
jgi:hypothetical protein